MVYMQRRRMVPLLFISIAAIVLAAGSAVAQDGQAEQWLPQPSQSDNAEAAEQQVVGEDVEPISVLGILGKLALVAGLIYAASWGLKLWQERDIGGSRAGSGGLIHIRESVSLGTGGRLYAVKFGDRTLLLVKTGEQVKILAESDREPSQKQETDPLSALTDIPGKVNGNDNGEKRSRGNGNGSGLRES